MTTLLHESWESGSNGASVTTGNTTWNRLATRFTFSSTHVPAGQGSLSGKLVVSAQTAQAQADVAASDQGYEETWWWADSLPPADLSIASFRNTAANQNLAELRLGADGTVSIRDAGFVKIASSPAAAFKTGQWMKIQRYYGNSSGQARLRVFWTNPAGNTPDYDSGLVATTAAGQITFAQVGAITATTWTAWIGDYDLNTTGFIVPSGGGGSGGTVGYRAGTSAQAQDSAHTVSVTVPSTVAAGDLMLLKFVAGQQANQTTPAGWTKLPISQSTTGLCFDAWQKVAASGDHDTTVTVTSDNTVSFSRHLHLDVYSAGKVGDLGSNLASTASAAHNTPSVVVQDPQAWIENGAADRGTPPSSGFTLPANLTQRALQVQTSGGGAVSSIAATDDAVGSGSLGSNTITGTLSTSKALTWTIAVEPTSAVTPLSVSAGPDVFVEPWRALTIAPSASATPDSWSWQQLSGVAAAGFTTPVTVTDVTSGATVDSNGTIHLTAPAEIVPMQYTLRVSGHKAGVSPDPGDNMVLTVYPATRAFVSSTGELKPIRYQLVT